MPGATWRQLYDIALDHHGFVTTTAAKAAGVDGAYLRQMTQRGTLEQVAYGLYRVPEVPLTEQAPYMEAVLWTGADAALSHDAVLALHGLASANPSVIRVVTPRRVRRRQRPPVPLRIIKRMIPAHQLTRYFAIPSTTVARALMDCRDLIMRSRLVEAAEQARREGLLRDAELDAVFDVLGRREPAHHDG